MIGTLALIKELEHRQEKERLRYFIPNGSQERFIRLVGEGNDFIYLFVGGNGVGKTALVMNILGNIVYGPQNRFFDLPLFRDFPYPKRIRIATESKNVEEIGSIDQEITTWWPEGRYEGSKQGKLYLSQYRSDTGFLIDKMSYEQDTKEYESSTLGVAVFDEPPPKDKFSATVARMRKGGVIIFSMTPLTNAGWILDDIIDAHDQKSAVVYADIEDNCKEHGLRGTLDHKNIQRMIDNMDPDEIDARARGKFMHVASVIFSGAFKREFHVVPDDLEPPMGAEWGTVVDPARGKPWAIGSFWFDARGQIVFDDEYPKEDWTRCKETSLMTNDFVEVVKIMEQGKRVTMRIIDRHYANARDNYNRTLKMDLSDKFGMDFQNSYNSEKEVDQGIQGIKDYLGFNKKMPIDTQNFPRLLIKKRCKNIIRALERWPRNPETLRPDENSHYKDHADIVRYAVMAKPEVWIPKPLQPRPQLYAVGR